MPAKLSGYLCTLHQQQQKSKKKRIRRKKRRQHCDRHSHKSIYTCNTCIVRRRVRIEWAVSRVLLLTLPKFRWQILLQTLTDTHTRHSWIQLACFLFLLFRWETAAKPRHATWRAAQRQVVSKCHSYFSVDLFHCVIYWILFKKLSVHEIPLSYLR